MLETRLRNTSTVTAGAASSSTSGVVYAPTGGFYIAYGADAGLANEKILMAGSSVTLVSDATTVWVNALTNATGSVTIATILFNSSNLTSGGSGVLIASHNLSKQYVFLQLYDSANRLTFPDNYNCNSTSSAEVDLTNYGVITGSWNLLAI